VGYNESMKMSFFVIPFLAIVVAVAGNVLTSRGLSSWYEGLALPAWTPPGAIIGIVWTVIYTLTAASALIVWNTSRRDRRFWLVIGLFVANALLNVGWSYLFFSAHLIGAAFFEMLVLETTVIGLIVLLRPTARWAALLLYPYATWVGFATYLTYVVWQLN
jgi:translocator protein